MGQDSKRDAIIEAAKKRFSHFGVGKTTMNEIADDLAISKASLYYYFPDKLSLYAAVLHEIIESDNVHHQGYEGENDPGRALMLYLDNRIKFIDKYYNILEHLQVANLRTSKELAPIFSLVRTRQTGIIAGIIERGKASGKLEVSHSNKTAELLLDCMEGISSAALSEQNNFAPDKKIFQSILKREKELAAIFMKGLRK